jgi:thymidylate synthase
VYGRQWRKWNCTEARDIEGTGLYAHAFKQIDQIANLINDLKTNPDSRRLMVNAWNVGEIDRMVLPPCHYGFQVYTRELSFEERLAIFEKRGYVKNLDLFDWVPSRAISLMWNQRSVDTFLGLPFNIASYGLLLEIIAKEVNMVPDELIGNLGDVHLYTNHIEQAKEQIGRELTYSERYKIWYTNNFETGFEYNEASVPDFDNTYYEPTPKRTREPYALPRLCINTLRSDTNTILGDIAKWSYEDFTLENYQSHPAIKAPLSN